jgi:purine-nucleoside phosphorylase
MDYSSYFPNVDDAVAWLGERVPIKPDVVVVLSGGLGDFVEGMTDKVTISSSDIPHFPTARAEGHSGKIVFGKHDGVSVAVLVGRYHYYEGHSPQDVVFPYFVLSGLGARTLVTTNAVGGVNAKFNPGDVMMVTDHINMMGINPLIGIAIQRNENQFTSLTNAYDAELQSVARNVASDIGLDMKEGVYLATSGPSYETKAEVGAFRQMGADTVGMSTVPAVIAANFLGMRVLTFSCIANPAADLHSGKMTHQEVLDAMNALAPKVVELLRGVVGKLS